MNSFNLETIFCDGMVLQRNKNIRVWGECEKGTTITISINNHKAFTKSLSNRWEVILPPMKACNSCQMEVWSDNPKDEVVLIKNVAIGEVWVAGGQSNMEFPLKYDTQGEEEIRNADNPYIRFFDCPKVSYEGQEQIDDYSDFGKWRICDEYNTPLFSAVGYYFAQDVYKSQGVPVGIVGCNWGGTTASTWLDKSYLQEDGELNSYIKEYEEVINELDMELYEKKYEASKMQLNSAEFKAVNEMLLAGTLTQEQIQGMLTAMSENPEAFMPLIGPKYFNRPGALYDNMLKKIAGYSIKGVIWYQGESDDVKANIYSKLFEAVIKCWRNTWKEELPFLFVQLAPFGSWLTSTGKEYPILRQQQEAVALKVPNVYMASIMDVGMEFDIHPKNKKPVGERLALLARNKVYGEELVSEAPEFVGFNLTHEKLTIFFRHVGAEFMLKGHTVNGLQVYIDDIEIKDFECELSQNKLLINCEMFKDNCEVEIRFAWLPYVEVNLYSSYGLPVKPFKIQSSSKNR